MAAAVRKRRIRRGLRGWRSGELVFFIAAGLEERLVFIAVRACGCGAVAANLPMGSRASACCPSRHIRVTASRLVLLLGEVFFFPTFFLVCRGVL